MSSKISHRVAEAIHAAAIRILRIVRVQDIKAGIGPAQLSALSILVFLGPKTMGELAEAEQVKAPTMTRIADALVRQQLADRATSGADRRSLRIAATAKGRKLLLASRDRRVQALAKRLENLSDSELIMLKKAAQILSVI